MTIPSKITAGDSVTWFDDTGRDSIGGEVTSPAWTLTYVLRGSTALTLTSVPNGNGWKTTLTKAQSATLTPGKCYWQAIASNGDNRVTLGSGEITVAADMTYTGTAAAFDGRSQAQIDLEAVRAAMRAIVTGGATQEYSIGNRSLKKMSMPDLIALESKLKADVAREARADRIAKGLSSGRSVFVRF